MDSNLNKYSERAKELSALLNKANHSYYVLDSPEIEDSIYDQLYRELIEIENIKPSLIFHEKYSNIKYEQIISEDTSKKVNLALRKIVTAKEGTASFANIKGYEIAGKTGTAQKSVDGGYSRNKINTFASIFPASDPKYVLIVMLDEPKPNQNYIYEYKDGSGLRIKGTQFNTAGWTAVEVTGKIIEKIGPILATKY